MRVGGEISTANIDLTKNWIEIVNHDCSTCDNTEGGLNGNDLGDRG